MSLNTSGGLYGYRASKAAVNAIMKSMSIDLAGAESSLSHCTPDGCAPTWEVPNAAIDAVESVSRNAQGHRGADQR